MFSGNESDRLAIRELIDSYSDAATRFDSDSWIANWADDAIWDFGGARFEGRKAILEAWQGAMADIELIMVRAYPGSIDAKGDQASVVTHTFEHVTPKAGPPIFLAGLYQDRLVRDRSAGWLFAHRTFTYRPLSVSPPAI